MGDGFSGLVGYLRSVQGTRKGLGGGATSKCSQEECLRLIDRSLTEFQAEKPHARFEYVASASSSDPKSLVSNRPKRILIGELHQRRETLAYNWERQGIEVSFYRQDYDSYWTMTVRDSWSVMNQALSPNGEKKWGLSESKASMQECLRMIDQSLADFHTEKPTAKLQSIDIELQIIKELWGDILEGLRERLSTLSGEKSPGRFESGGPQNLDQELN